MGPFGEWLGDAAETTWASSSVRGPGTTRAGDAIAETALVRGKDSARKKNRAELCGKRGKGVISADLADSAH